MILINTGNITIKRHMLDMMQFRDKDDKPIFVEENAIGIPENAVAYDFISTSVTTIHNVKNDEGKWVDVLTGNSTWSEDLVVAIFNNTGATLKESIFIASLACEACLNVLADNYGLSWGYPYNSEEFKSCGTSCNFCKN